MPINVLAPEVISKIAAGEVVERPASVVKELVENSLDAGATQIAVEVSGGGVRLVRVVDNGAGIGGREVELAFQRHATSKLAGAADLAHISSLGFRGEALPSIAAVAEVTMVTRGEGEVGGTFLNIKDGNIIEKAKRGCPQGTTVTVRNLFRNVPARLKFLKSTSTENGHIGHLLTQYILAFPEVRFTLIIDGRTALRSPGSGKLRDALIQAYGLETARALLEIGLEGGENGAPVITGFISPPSVSRSSRRYISLLVNRRWVQSRALAYAVEEAYHGLLMTGRHPIAALNILMPPEELDVNVHPAKSEVRFQNEHEVFRAVRGAVGRTLDKEAPVAPMRSQPRAAVPPRRGSGDPLSFIPPREMAARPLFTAQEKEPGPGPRDVLPILRVIGQMGGTYIIAEGPDGMYLIDQHAAHERVLFERIQEQQGRHEVEVQGLLQPLTVGLTAEQEERLKTRQEALAEYGFAIEPFGERTCLVRAVPALLSGRDVAESLLSALDSLDEATSGDWREKLAISLACHGAVRAGQTLEDEEIRELVRQLERTSQPRTCPHGRPTMVHLNSSQLEREFGRR